MMMLTGMALFPKRDGGNVGVVLSEIKMIDDTEPGYCKLITPHGTWEVDGEAKEVTETIMLNLNHQLRQARERRMEENDDPGAN